MADWPPVMIVRAPLVGFIWPQPALGLAGRFASPPEPAAPAAAPPAPPPPVAVVPPAPPAGVLAMPAAPAVVPASAGVEVLEQPASSSKLNQANSGPKIVRIAPSLWGRAPICFS